jgi:transcriptional regulator with XRE-family HTH domain
MVITRIREVRKAKHMTLHEVALACTPATTAQTIGRLETGMRTVSVGWLNRIAGALGVEAASLVTLPDRVDVPIAALLTTTGIVAPNRPMAVVPPVPAGNQVGVLVEAAFGEYRPGDQIWLERLAPEDFGRAVNRDVLVPRPVGRFIFGRLIATDGAKLQILPVTPGVRQMVVTDAVWIGVARTLIRGL